MLFTGTILGFRPFSGNGSRGPFHATELYVARSNPDDGVVGQQIDRFAAFDNALGGYIPAVGHGVQYHLFYNNGKQQCGYVLHLPQLDIDFDDVT